MQDSPPLSATNRTSQIVVSRNVSRPALTDRLTSTRKEAVWSKKRYDEAVARPIDDPVSRLLCVDVQIVWFWTFRFRQLVAQNSKRIGSEIELIPKLDRASVNDTICPAPDWGRDLSPLRSRLGSVALGFHRSTARAYAFEGTLCRCMRSAATQILKLAVT